MKVKIYTFGCTVNQCDSQSIRAQLRAWGDEIIEQGEADAVIINGCAVTSAVEKNAESLLHRIKRQRPEALVAVVGCFGEALKKLNRAGRISAENDLFKAHREINALAIRRHALSPSTSLPGFCFMVTMTTSASAKSSMFSTKGSRAFKSVSHPPM